MPFTRRLSLALLLTLSSLAAQTARASVTVFQEPNFPSADTAPFTPDSLHVAFPQATFADTQGLPAALTRPDITLLVLPYGSAFPESDWSALLAFLNHGGNLLVLGGKAFFRPAYQENGEWHLRPETNLYSAALRIDQYQSTPGSTSLHFQPNPDIPEPLPAFPWTAAYSPILHLSSSNLGARGGSSGREDARLDAFAWGEQNGRKLAAPALRLDHLQSQFGGGRWVFLNAQLPPDFISTPQATTLLQTLARSADGGALDFRVEPVMPVYAADEAPQLRLTLHGPRIPTTPLTLELTFATDGGKPTTRRLAAITNDQVVVLPATPAKGLHRIDARLLAGDHTLSITHTAFWTRDLDYLRSGPRLSVDADHLRLDDKPIIVAGTTYMSSDVQRLFFAHPNPWVWDRDMADFEHAGINMLRSGWWSGWDGLVDENGRPSERTLRTLEAFLMSARAHGLPVQFNVFAFLPDVLGGGNAYLDPQATERELTLYTALAARFHDVPFLAWDLINEPSYGEHLWSSQPNGDPLELAAWNAFLTRKYPSRTALALAWNQVSAPSGAIPVPAAAEYGPGGASSTLNLNDFYLFQQEVFANWVAKVRSAIHGTGSSQLITVGQDEGGNSTRLLAAYFGPSVDFTCNHSWNQNDNLLWNTLLAKQPGKPMLIQEFGVAAGTGPLGLARLSLADQNGLYARKLTLSLAGGDGAIDWLWFSNVFMMENGEVSLGGIRGDGTEKPQIATLRAFAAFAKAAGPTLSAPELPPVAIITSQAAQFSAMQSAETEAQEASVHALGAYARVTARILAENQLEPLAQPGKPRLAILPSPQAFGDAAWQQLLAYVRAGGNLLITGSVNRDTHWNVVDRLADVGLHGTAEPLHLRDASITATGLDVPLSFNQSAQSRFEAVHFDDGSSLKQVTLGQGKIFWSAYPAELAEDLRGTGMLYRYVQQQIGLTPLFGVTPNGPSGSGVLVYPEFSPGVLVYPVVSQNTLLYLFASTDATDADLHILDRATLQNMFLKLPAGGAAAILLDRHTGKEIARFAPVP